MTETHSKGVFAQKSAAESATGSTAESTTGSAAESIAGSAAGKIGAVILAAGLASRMGSFKPMLKIGPLTAVQHLVRSFRQAGVECIALVTGSSGDLLEAHMKGTGVFCLRNANYASGEMLDSVKIGLSFLANKCDRVFLTPADIPLFKSETLRSLIACDAPAAAPSCAGKSGHPLLLSGEIFAHVEAYTGPGGLGGAIKAYGRPLVKVETEDEGVLLDMDSPADYEKLLAFYARGLPGNGQR